MGLTYFSKAVVELGWRVLNLLVHESALFQDFP